MNYNKQQKLLDYLFTLITVQKQARIKEILNNRTCYITLALEDIYQSHNLSAALRSAECFGLTDAHIIEQTHKFVLNTSVAKGAASWMQLHRYRGTHENNTQLCYQSLRNQGYSIVATSPHPTGYVLQDLPLDKPCALIFGTEETGLSEFALKNADVHVRIPTYGFTESFNISVSVAICLYDLTKRLRTTDCNWKLNDHQKQEIALTWLRKIISGCDEHEKRFLADL